jgi:hypothetical protein
MYNPSEYSSCRLTSQAVKQFPPMHRTINLISVFIRGRVIVVVVVVVMAVLVVVAVMILVLVRAVVV